MDKELKNEQPVSAHPDPGKPEGKEPFKPVTEHPDPEVHPPKPAPVPPHSEPQKNTTPGGRKTMADQKNFQGNVPGTTEKSHVGGELTYEDKVIQKIIGIALEEIDGLLTVDGGFFSNIAEKLVNTDNVTSGINTEVGKKQVAVDMDVVVEYGKDIESIYDEMKDLISEEVNKMTHLDVIEVNVNVVDIKTRAEYEEDSETVQDKVTDAAGKTKDATVRQASKAKDAAGRGVDKVRDNDEPRVQ